MSDQINITFEGKLRAAPDLGGDVIRLDVQVQPRRQSDGRWRDEGDELWFECRTVGQRAKTIDSYELLPGDHVTVTGTLTQDGGPDRPELYVEITSIGKSMGGPKRRRRRSERRAETSAELPEIDDPDEPPSRRKAGRHDRESIRGKNNARA